MPAGIILQFNTATEPCTAWCTGQSSGGILSNGVKQGTPIFSHLQGDPEGFSTSMDHITNYEIILQFGDGWHRIKTHGTYHHHRCGLGRM